MLTEKNKRNVSCGNLAAANVLFAMQDLSVKVALLDGVVIAKPERANTRAAQERQATAAQTTATHHQHASTAQRHLTRTAKLIQKKLTPVTLNFVSTKTITLHFKTLILQHLLMFRSKAPYALMNLSILNIVWFPILLCFILANVSSLVCL
jgi:hypothetical protein